MLFEYIDQYSSISIFHHERADFDALGSSFALKLYIEEHFNKEVKIIGNDVASIEKYFPFIEQVSDEYIKSSLAIIVDTANQERIDDNRINLAKFRVKIDHHINVNQYAEYEIVDDKAAATCEILAKIFYNEKRPLSKRCAQYLYLGLISDTINFTTSNTSSNTLFYASYISQFIDNVAEISRLIFDKSLDEFKYECYLKKNIQFDGDTAYVIIDKEYENFNIHQQKAKEMVYIMSGIQGIEKWALFIKMKNGYGVSLRSKEIPINELARKYGGGGHLNASGIKDVSDENILKIIKELKQLK